MGRDAYAAQDVYGVGQRPHSLRLPDCQVLRGGHLAGVPRGVRQREAGGRPRDAARRVAVRQAGAHRQLRHHGTGP